MSVLESVVQSCWLELQSRGNICKFTFEVNCSFKLKLRHFRGWVTGSNSHVAYIFEVAKLNIFMFTGLLKLCCVSRLLMPRPAEWRIERLPAWVSLGCCSFSPQQDCWWTLNRLYVWMWAWMKVFLCWPCDRRGHVVQGLFHHLPYELGCWDKLKARMPLNWMGCLLSSIG